MQSRPPQGMLDGDQGQALLALCAAALLCWLFFDSFVYGTCWILYWLWMLADFPRVHLWAAEKINLLAGVANNAEGVSFDEWLTVMNETSGILLLFLVPVLVAGTVALAQHPALGFRSKRPVDIHSLPGLLSRFAPSVAPVLAMNGGRDGLMNDTRPENAWAQRPEEFAAWHNLVERQTLSRDACLAAFGAQLGTLLHGEVAYAPAQWAPHERALLAIFGLQVFCNDRQAATRLADDLNRSCLQKGLLRRRIAPMPLWRLSDAALQRVLAAPGMADWLATHISVRSALAGLYGRDLRLPSVRFRWLKGVDRTLWYALHSADTAKVFVEGAGVLAQTRAERHARKLGLPRPGVMVMEAVEGLQADLESIGLVYAREAPVSQGTRPRDVPVQDAPWQVDGEVKES